jgi:hypothetical protein
VAVNARAKGGPDGLWELGVFVSVGEMKGESVVVVDGDPGDSRTSQVREGKGRAQTESLELGKAGGYWLAKFTDQDRGQVTLVLLSAEPIRFP